MDLLARLFEVDRDMGEMGKGGRGRSAMSADAKV